MARDEGASGTTSYDFTVSLSSPAGCLFPYRNLATGETDFSGVWGVLAADEQPIGFGQVLSDGAGLEAAVERDLARAQLKVAEALAGGGQQPNSLSETMPVLAGRIRPRAPRRCSRRAR